MQSPTQSQLNTGFLFAIASAALFAIRPIFVKLVYAEGVSPLTLIALRMLFSMPIYAVILIFLLRKRENRALITPKITLQIAVIGLFGYYMASFLDLIGLQYVSAQLGRMILYIYPTFTVLLGIMLFARKINAYTILSLFITYTGVAIIFGHELSTLGSDVIKGGLFIIGSAITFAIYLVLGKPLIDKTSSQLFTCIALIAASLGIFMHYAIHYYSTELIASNVNHTALILIAIIALFCTVFPTFFTTAAMAKIGANKTGIIAMIGPAFTSVFAVIILAEAFTIYHLLGISLSVVGLFILRKA